MVESTESMTVIDVNTGKYTGRSNLEETILKTNLEAAEEVVRQLRLRNIGGLIVIDFIDMATQTNRQKLFKFFEKTLRERDKFQSVVLKISEFGLVEMTRKRSGKTLLNQLMQPCENCRGFGMVKSVQTDCYMLLQKFKNEFKMRKAGQPITMHVHPVLFSYMTNIEYNGILYLEKVLNCAITLVSDSTVPLNSYQIDRA